MKAQKVKRRSRPNCMVLAANEWLNNSNDEHKSTTAIAPTTTTATATSATSNTPSAAAGNHAIAGQTQITTTIDSTKNNAIAAISNTTAPTTTGTANANNEIMSENINSETNVSQQQVLQQQPQQQQQQTQKQQEQITEQQLKSNLTEILPVAPADVNDVKNVKATQEIVNNNSEVLNCDTSAANAFIVNINSNSTTTNINTNSADIANTNNANQSINNTNTNVYSNPSSNASTLQSPIVRQAKANTVTAGTALPLSSPITPQALSSALQSVMNGQTAKELSSAFVSGLVDVQTNIANNIGSNALQNVCSSSNVNINLDTTADNNGQAKIVLLCEANSHPFQTRTIILTPNIECKVGRLIAKSKASESNAIFDCKVLSRNHAVLWYTDEGKFWVKDTKSSNGTFINESKLGNEAAELHFGDIVKFGVDVVENSRKEVHGCIIAFVKLYLPDGREAISIDTSSQWSQYSGEGRISYEEMHRLNLYMQEVSQREKVLKSKLFNIQNVLDATRKNSALCWQSLIAEDQLLHRINTLEKKLQIMEKNVPESVLRNEVLKLIEDKNSYQLTAKEALRKVYEERCDALQMLSKMELAYANSDGECKILRDQIMNTKQSLQDVNTRLQRLETDYNEYKEEAERKQQEIKEQEEQRLAEMSEKLQQRELECDDLRRRVSEFMLQHAEVVDEEEKQLQLQAIEKLDAVIGDMDLGEDDDEDDDDDDVADENDIKAAKGDEGDGEHKEDGNEKDGGKKAIRSTKLNGVGVKGAKSVGSNNESEVLNTSAKSDVATNRSKAQGTAKESTILKWLQNSDLNQKEGSIDIFKAICNESDSSDEQDLPIIENDAIIDSGIDTNTASAEDIKLKYKKSKNKLQNVQTILCQLVEAEMSSKECYKSPGADTTNEHNNEVVVENEALTEIRSEGGCEPMNGEQKLLLLKRSVAMLSEAYKDICDSGSELELQKAIQDNIKGISPPPAKTTSLLNTSSAVGNKLITQETLKPLAETVDAAEADEYDLIAEQETTDNDELQSEECTTVTTPSTIVSPHAMTNKEMSLRDEVRAYQEQIKELNSKLEQVESDAQNTLEIMQIECDTFKEKVAQLNKVVQKAVEEKQELERMLDERAEAMEKQQQRAVEQILATNATSAETKEPLQLTVAHAANIEHEKPIESSLDELRTRKTDTKLIADSTLDTDFEAQLNDDLAAINSNALQREEELIVYKERLERTQNDNLQLRNEVAALLLKTGTQAQTHMVKQMLAYGAVVVAIIIYFITTYF
ncbi:sarcolemmal membrane-associated protein isoform X1 [Ceratitis capitata]|uniref:sarcolemmal membrane-associated protein isoform X1 n=2 Tax=Ceratitis capitata TaxID=7213 RepID=UPI00032A237B|nr:sarcolemmal membrane-associated protein isoform X1 [Ceratitis capitata]